MQFFIFRYPETETDDFVLCLHGDSTQNEAW